MKFYICPICGNVITLLEGNIDLVKCCGAEMKELIPNTVDCSLEKHVPVYEVNSDKIIVSVGEVEHPMEEEHHISFIAQVVGNSVNIVKLNTHEKPEATFQYVASSTIFAYCNIHGLWSKSVE